MKTIWPSGLALLAVTEISLVGVLIVFMDLLRYREFTALHLVFIALFLCFPAHLWVNRIELDRHILRFQSWNGTQIIFVNQIEHIYVTPQDRSYLLSVHLRNRPPHKFVIDLFNHDEIKNLLQDLKTQNTKMQISVVKDF